MGNIVKYAILFLEKKTFCQNGEGADVEDGEFDDEQNPEDDYGSENEEGDDGIDHDEVILGNTTDWIIAVARASGNSFAPWFATLAPHIVAYTGDKHPKYDKNMALGCIAEVFAACEGVIPTYFNDYLPLLEKNSNTNDSKVNRNISYSLGVLAEHAPLLFQPHVNNALALLKKLHDCTTQIDAQDNIIAAFCRIIEFQFMPLPAEQRPAEYNSLIESIYAKVPLTGDDTENECILKMSFKLYQSDQANCLKFMDKIA